MGLKGDFSRSTREKFKIFQKISRKNLDKKFFRAILKPVSILTQIISLKGVEK